MANPTPTSLVGATSALQGDSIRLGITHTAAAAAHTHISFITNAHVLTFIGTSIEAAITDVSIFCAGTSVSSIIPDAWQAPAAATTEADGIAKCHYLGNTNVYQPETKLEMADFITAQIKPAVLIGGQPSVLVYTPAATTFTVKFTLTRKGIMPARPWAAAAGP